MVTIIVLSFLIIVLTGFASLKKDYSASIAKSKFLFDYRQEFAILANHYLNTYSPYTRRGEIDNEKYIWLTLNANKAQAYLGANGVMEYIGHFHRYTVSNYQILLNALPKFKDGTLEEFDINSVDNALLRAIGVNEELASRKKKRLINPSLWFREGVRLVIGFPFYLLSWFGIIPEKAAGRITTNIVFQVIAGIVALAGFLSSLVTIIQGKEQTLLFIKEVLKK